MSFLHHCKAVGFGSRPVSSCPGIRAGRGERLLCERGSRKPHRRCFNWSVILVLDQSRFLSYFMFNQVAWFPTACLIFSFPWCRRPLWFLFLIDLLIVSRSLFTLILHLCIKDTFFSPLPFVRLV